MIEILIKDYSNGKIKIENKTEEKTPMGELSKKYSSNNECLCSKNEWVKKI